MRRLPAAAAACAVAAWAAGCHKDRPDESSPPSAYPAAGAGSEPTTPRGETESSDWGVDAGDGGWAAESIRFMPPEYGDLRIGQPKNEVLAAYSEARPAREASDPERLEWYQFDTERGLRVMLGFDTNRSRGPPALAAAQFLSLLALPRGGSGTSAPGSELVRNREWMEAVYEPHIRALRERYGDRPAVYSCPSGGPYPMVRAVWRGERLALTAAFLLHEKGLGSTLMITRVEVADRYIEATRCVWVQERLL